jgi:MFS transporter, ACS family, D-galactonate transporter
MPVDSGDSDRRLDPDRGASWGGTVILLMVVVATGHFNRIGISVAGAERIIPQYGITPKNMGLVYSAFLLFYTLAMLPGGWLVDRLGARAALVFLGFGSAIFVALTGATGLALQGGGAILIGLIVVRGSLGLTNAPLHPASARMVFDRVPRGSRGLANGLVTFSACLGIAASYHAMGTLIDLFDWPTAFLVSGGLTVMVASVWTFCTRPSRKPFGTAPIPRYATSDPAYLLRVIGDRSVICITLAYAAYGYFQYLFFYWIEYYFVEIQQQSVSVARGYSTMITLAMGVGMISGGWLADRVPRSFSLRTRRALVPVLGMIASGVVFEAGLLASSAQATLVAFVLAAALLGLCEAAFWLTSVELGGSLGGTAAGLMNTGGNAGGTLSPYLTPVLSSFFVTHYGDDVGWRLSLAIAGVVVVAGAALWWGVHPPGESDAEPENLAPVSPDADQVVDA